MPSIAEWRNLANDLNETTRIHASSHSRINSSLFIFSAFFLLLFPRFFAHNIQK